jgi:hypothetical protein
MQLEAARALQKDYVEHITNITWKSLLCLALFEVGEFARYDAELFFACNNNPNLIRPITAAILLVTH